MVECGNYISFLGSHALGAYDVDTQTPIPVIDKHGYAVSYYQDTISDEATDGFYWSRVGGHWDDPQRNALPIYGEEEIETTKTLISLDLITKDSFDTAESWYRNGDVQLNNGVAVLTEGSPAFLFEELIMPDNLDFLGFDFKFTELGQGDYLALHFNEYFLFGFDGTLFSGSEFRNSGLIPVAQYAGQDGWLTFSLNSTGERDSQVMIDNLAFYDLTVGSLGPSVVPEPSTIILMSFGIGGVFFTSRKRKKTLNPF